MVLEALELISVIKAKGKKITSLSLEIIHLNLVEWNLVTLFYEKALTKVQVVGLNLNLVKNQPSLLGRQAILTGKQFISRGSGPLGVLFSKYPIHYFHQKRINLSIAKIASFLTFLKSMCFALLNNGSKWLPPLPL